MDVTFTPLKGGGVRLVLHASDDVDRAMQSIFCAISLPDTETERQDG